MKITAIAFTLCLRMYVSNAAGAESASFDDEGFKFEGYKASSGQCSRYSQYFLGNYGALKTSCGYDAPKNFKDNDDPPTWYESRVKTCWPENELRIYDETCVVSEGNPLESNLGGQCKTLVSFHQCPRYANDYKAEMNEVALARNGAKCTIASEQTNNVGECIGETSIGSLSLSGERVEVCCKGYEGDSLFRGNQHAYFGVVPLADLDANGHRVRAAKCSGQTCEYSVACACPVVESWMGGLIFAPGEPTYHKFTVNNDGAIADPKANIVLAPEAGQDFSFREVFHGSPDSGTRDSYGSLLISNDANMRIGEPYPFGLQIVVKGATCSDNQGTIGIGNAGMIVKTTHDVDGKCDGNGPFEENMDCLKTLREKIVSMGEPTVNGTKQPFWPTFRDGEHAGGGLTRRLGEGRSLRAKASKGRKGKVGKAKKTMKELKCDKPSDAFFA